jgi:cell division transport system permease protein
MRGLGQIPFYFREAVAHIRSHLWPSLVTFSSIAVLLFLSGMGAWTWLSFEGLATSWREKARFIVYLQDDAADGQREAIAQTLAGLHEVQAVLFVSKDEALRRMRASLNGQQDILEGLEDNPLPASFEVTPKPDARRVDALDRVSVAVSELPGVDEVEYGRSWLGRLDAMSAVGRVVGLTGLILMASALVLLINNTIKLTLYTRLEELEILKLVGAPPLSMGAPYVIEGALKGLAGGILSGAAMVLVLWVIEARYGAALHEAIGLGPMAKLALPVAGAVVALGLLLGIVGSTNAVRTVVRRLP